MYFGDERQGQHTGMVQNSVRNGENEESDEVGNREEETFCS